MSFDGPMRGAGPPVPEDAVLPVEHGSLGKYHVFATLGRGGMADVYLAVARGPVGFNKLVVIKRLRAQLAEEAAFRDMFLDEARLAARLSHPNIVNTFEVGEEAGSHFIAMEYLEGQALNKVIREAIQKNVPIAPAMAARILADMLLGLSYAHNVTDYDGSPLGIIHRDVSPHNIFVTYDGSVKVVDFGIAKAASTTTETEVGVLKGKVAYMAPEHATGTKIDARADVFAAGIVLWELLTRQRLFPGENAAVTIHRLMSQPIAPPRSHDPRIPRELEDIVMRALEKDPAQRFQSAADMRSALEGFIARSSGGVRPEEIGALLQHLFASVREDVQTKIRTYMARYQQVGSKEMRALTVESVQRLHNSTSGAPTASSSASLLRLGSTAQRVGRMPTFPPPPTGSGAAASHHSGSAELRKGRGLILPVLLAGCFFLAIALLLVFGWMHRTPEGEGAVASGSAPPSVLPKETASALPLASATASATATTAPTASVASNAPRPLATHLASSAATVRLEPTTKATEAPVVGEPGFLTLDTYPWTKVSEGARVLGTTPLVRIQLPAGPHTLTFDNPEQSIHQTSTVVVKAGETVTKRLAFK